MNYPLDFAQSCDCVIILDIVKSGIDRFNIEVRIKSLDNGFLKVYTERNTLCCYLLGGHSLGIVKQVFAELDYLTVGVAVVLDFDEVKGAYTVVVSDTQKTAQRGAQVISEGR